MSVVPLVIDKFVVFEQYDGEATYDDEKDIGKCRGVADVGTAKIRLRGVIDDQTKEIEVPIARGLGVLEDALANLEGPNEGGYDLIEDVFGHHRYRYLEEDARLGDAIELRRLIVAARYRLETRYPEG